MTLNFRLKPAERCESKSIESDVESRPRPSAVPIQMALEEQWLLAVMGRLGLDGRHVETTAPQKDLGATCRILAAAPPLAIALILDARSRHLGGVLLDPRRRLAVDAFSPAALDDARPGTIADAAEAALAEARVRHSGACHVAALVLRAGDFDVVARVARCGPDRGPAPEPGAHCRELVLWAPEPGAARLEPAPGGPWTFPVLPVRPVAAAAAVARTKASRVVEVGAGRGRAARAAVAQVVVLQRVGRGGRRVHERVAPRLDQVARRRARARPLAAAVALGAVEREGVALDVGLQPVLARAPLSE